MQKRMDKSLPSKASRRDLLRRWNLLMNKKADMPYWMVMLLWTLVGLFVVLGIVMLQKEKFFAFLEWLG